MNFISSASKKRKLCVIWSSEENEGELSIQEESLLGTEVCESVVVWCECVFVWSCVCVSVVCVCVCVCVCVVGGVRLLTVSIVIVNCCKRHR